MKATRRRVEGRSRTGPMAHRDRVGGYRTSGGVPRERRRLEDLLGRQDLGTHRGPDVELASEN